MIAVRREHLAAFVVTEIAGTEAEPTFTRRIDAKRRKELELKVGLRNTATSADVELLVRRGANRFWKCGRIVNSL